MSLVFSSAVLLLLPRSARAQKPVLDRSSCLFGAVCDDLRPCCSGGEGSVGQCCVTDGGGTGAWGDGRAVARRDSAEHFSRLGALLFTAVAWIFIPAYCFARP